MEVTLTADDLAQSLLTYAAGRVEGLKVRLEPGVIILTHAVVVEKMPVAISVELHIMIRAVHGTAIEAEIDWANLPLLPGFIKEMALKRAFEPLPGHYANGRLIVDLATVMEHVPISFRLTAIDVTATGVRASLTDVTAYPINAAGLGAAASVALVPIPSAEEAEIPEHQSFYRKLRAKVNRFTEKNAPAWLAPLVPWAMVVPDFFVLVVRLARDPRVPNEAKLLAGVAVAYFISPIDLIPDAILILGQLDDIAVAIFVVDKISKMVPHEVIEEAWPGDGKVLDLVGEGSHLFAKVLPAKMLVAIRRLIRRR